MKVLGIDPGSLFIGYALLEGTRSSVRYLDSGTLKCGHIKNFYQRLYFIYAQSIEMLEKYKPDCIAFESLVYVKNPKSSIKLSQARGAMIAAFASTHANVIFEYSPNLVKSSVSGHGHANKQGIQKSIATLLSGSRQKQTEFETHDESDAIAIAFCHLLNATGPYPNRIARKRRGSNLSGSLQHMLKEVK